MEVWKDSYKLLEMKLYLKKFLVVPPHLHTMAADQARRLADDAAGPLWGLGLS